MTTNFVSEGMQAFLSLPLILSNRAFLVISCLVAGLYFFLRPDPRLNYHLKKLSGPPSYPVIGNALSFIRPHHEYTSLFDNWINKYGTTLCIWLGSFRPYVVTAEPDVIEKILTSNFEKAKYEYSHLYDWLGWGLVTAPRQKWVHTRKLLTPAFHFKILSDFLPIFNNQASILLKCLERDSLNDGKTFDMFPYLTKLTTDVICETAMGKKLQAQTNSYNEKYSEAVANYAMLLFNKRVKLWLRIPLIYKLTLNYKAEKEYLRVLKELPAQIIEAKKLERQKKKSCHEYTCFNDKENRAFLDLLLDTSENNPERFTEKNIEEEVATFMFAGHDTIAVFFTWAIHLLANYPECQEKLQEELDTLFSNDDTRDVTVTDLTDMKYLECCIKEILRLYPSAPFIMRSVDSDIMLKNGNIIPKGATVAISIYYTHRNPDFYDDPNAFKPERWLENAVKRHPYSYIPFSAGPRNCIGQKYAMMEAKVVMAKLFRDYWIEPVDKLETLRKMPHLVLRCDNGVRVKLLKRKTS